MLFAISIKKSKPLQYVINTYEDEHATPFKFDMNCPLEGNSVSEFTENPEEAMLFDTYNLAIKFCKNYKLHGIEVVTLLAKTYLKAWDVKKEVKTRKKAATPKPNAEFEKKIKVERFAL